MALGLDKVPKKIVAAWKKKYGADFVAAYEKAHSRHGEVIHIELEDGKECFIGRPNRRIVGLAMSKSRTNPLGLIEVILQNCWIAGDEEVKTDGGCLVGLTELADDIIGTVKAKVKKY